MSLKMRVVLDLNWLKKIGFSPAILTVMAYSVKSYLLYCSGYEMIRFSKRTRSPRLQDGMRRIAVEGHGSYHYRDNRKPRVIPPCRELVLFTDIGVCLGENHCREISATWKSRTTPGSYIDDDGDIVTSIIGRQSEWSGHMRIYRVGDVYPDLRLYPYNGPDAYNMMVQPGSYVLEYDPMYPHKYEKLSSILENPDSIGCQVFWLACSSFASGFKPGLFPSHNNRPSILPSIHF